MNDLLLNKLSRLSEPDRSVDCEILQALGHQALHRGPRIGWEWRKFGAGLWHKMPSPTGSIDTAVNIVVPMVDSNLRYDWMVGQTNGGLTIHAKVGRTDDVFADTPAIALCMAGLMMAR